MGVDTIKWLGGSEKREETSFQHFIDKNNASFAKYTKHSFKQFYCLKHVFDSFGHIGLLETCLWQESLYRFIPRNIPPFVWSHWPSHRAQLTVRQDELVNYLTPKRRLALPEPMLTYFASPVHLRMHMALGEMSQLTRFTKPVWRCLSYHWERGTQTSAIRLFH